jgi:hypothetical protein
MQVHLDVEDVGLAIDLRSQLSHRAPFALADFTLRLSSRRFHDASTNEILG